MKYLIIRHAKTDANRFTRVAFGAEGAPINEIGKAQATALQQELLERGIDLTTEPVAVSELQRTRQTAEAAGLKNITVNSLLNEINTGNPEKTTELVAQAKVPEQALVAAQAIIANPPKEKLWVTHGLVIAAIEVALGISKADTFIPGYCEVREIEL